MRKPILFIAAVSAFASTVAVAAPAEKRFVRDGTTYVYTTETDEAGATVLEGHRTSDGSAFRLVVKGVQVSGTSGGQPVAFRIAKPLVAAETVLASK